MNGQVRDSESYLGVVADTGWRIENAQGRGHARACFAPCKAAGISVVGGRLNLGM